jgi:hypothetical protein
MGTKIGAGEFVCAAAAKSPPAKTARRESCRANFTLRIIRFGFTTGKNQVRQRRLAL